MSEASAPKRVTRRTVAKGAAWTVPAIVVAVPAASAATSPFVPPPPGFEWEDGCATVGNGLGGCNGVRFTPQTPFLIHNPTGQTLVFQLTRAKSWIDGDPEPVAWNTAHQLWTNNGTEDDCGPQITTTSCGGYLSVTLDPDECERLWIVGPELRNASAFRMRVEYRWVTPSPECAVVDGPYDATPTSIIPSNNCDGRPVVTAECPT